MVLRWHERNPQGGVIRRRCFAFETCSCIICVLGLLHWFEDREVRPSHGGTLTMVRCAMTFDDVVPVQEPPRRHAGMAVLGPTRLGGWAGSLPTRRAYRLPPRSAKVARWRTEKRRVRTFLGSLNPSHGAKCRRQGRTWAAANRQSRLRPRVMGDTTGVGKPPPAAGVSGAQRTGVGEA